MDGGDVRLGGATTGNSLPIVEDSGRAALALASSTLAALNTRSGTENSHRQALALPFPSLLPADFDRGAGASHSAMDRHQRRTLDPVHNFDAQGGPKRVPKMAVGA